MAAKKFMYDLVVIGAGSGGVRASRIAAGHGAKVALIESSMNHGPPTYSAIGGTCVNVGCVPKKLMKLASLYSHDFENAALYGWDVKGDVKNHSWETFMEKKNAEISRLNGIYSRILSKVDILEGLGRIVSKNEIAVKQSDGSEQVVSAETILVAVGGWPHIPNVTGKEHAITSNEIFYQDKRPERVVVVGGGYIAVEFASILSGLGSAVTLMYRRDLFLRGFDGDVRKHLAEEMEKEGHINLMFNSNPSSIVKNADGSLTVTTEDGKVVEADAVLYATGRKAKTKDLGLENAGVEMRPDGSIPVNEYSKTNVDNIYAVGDVTDRINLTPVALLEGHCFADTMYGGKDRKPSHDYVAAAVFSHPEISTCGYSEEDAAKLFGDLTVYRSTFKPMLHSITKLDRKMLMKLIVSDKDQRVVGLHIVGDGASEIMQGFAVAMKMGARKEDFDATVGIHPTSAEELVTMRTPSYQVKDGKKVEGKL